jgi:gliding motility-associated-like protein
MISKTSSLLALLGRLSGLIFILLIGFSQLQASHNLAGDITYRALGNNSVEITVTTFTDPSAAYVDRCEIDLEIWNSTGQIKIADLQNIKRQNGVWNNDPLFTQVTCTGSQSAQMGEYIIGTIKKNIYKATFTFSGPGYYLVRYYDVARLNDIINMANSGSQAFFIESSVLINNYLGEQNSPQFLNHPIDQACTGKLWTHNPGGYDPDGDSLAYKFVNCRQYDPPSIPSPIICTGFQMPDQIGGNGPITIDVNTGLITWNVPNLIGIYNIAYVIEEYRNGQRIGFTYRDMAIFVNPCDNDPPVIEAPEEICVYAGDTVVFDFKIWDPNFFTSVSPPGDSVYFYLNNSGSQLNGPFAVAVSPAEIVVVDPPGLQIPPDFPVAHDDTIKGRFHWNTVCDHVRPAYYQVDFYAHDNVSYYQAHKMLSANHITRIKVIPRPLDGLVVTAANREITLNWNAHACDSTLGYEIYRRQGGGNFSQDTVCCTSDPSTAGYSLIGTNLGRNNTTFIDQNGGVPFDFGVEYCYLVRAFFESGIRSCATEQVCVVIQKDFPVLLKDSVAVTDPATGEIQVEWSRPTGVDPIFPGPYTYTLMRANDIDGNPTWATVASAIAFDDTTYRDVGLATSLRGYRYRVDLYDVNDQLIVEGNYGSSIFLSITPGDKVLNLQWRENVPWHNRKYYIYRAADFVSALTLIDSVPGNGGNNHYYTDRGLTNFEDYCYVVVSEGEYLVGDGVPDSVRNASQRECGIPQDFEPPCINTVAFDTTRNCVSLSVGFTWTYPDSVCGGDLDHFTIYRADNRDANYVLIAVVDSSQTSFNLSGLPSIADCYGISATDTNGNESDMVIFCFENCPQIEVGNVFTPNGDGVNDYFSPLTDRSVRVNFVQVFDRWGKQIFSTNSVSDPARLWDGRTTNGAEVPEGVYYYVIRFAEDHLPGYVPKPWISGVITLLR